VGLSKELMLASLGPRSLEAGFSAASVGLATYAVVIAGSQYATEDQATNGDRNQKLAAIAAIFGGLALASKYPATGVAIIAGAAAAAWGDKIVYGVEGALAPAPTVQPPSVQGWTALALSDTLALVNNKVYRAVISVSWPLSVLATNDRVKSVAESNGFTQVTVQNTPWGDGGPWPEGDYYVQGLYLRPSQAVSRPSQVIGAWQAS
jgi:hypothetical protein